MQAPDAATRDAAQATARIVLRITVIAMAAGIMVTTILTAVSSAEMTEAESRNAIEHQTDKKKTSCFRMKKESATGGLACLGRYEKKLAAAVFERNAKGKANRQVAEICTFFAEYIHSYNDERINVKDGLTPVKSRSKAASCHAILRQTHILTSFEPETVHLCYNSKNNQPKTAKHGIDIALSAMPVTSCSAERRWPRPDTGWNPERRAAP